MDSSALAADYCPARAGKHRSHTHEAPGCKFPDPIKAARMKYLAQKRTLEKEKQDGSPSGEAQKPEGTDPKKPLTEIPKVPRRKRRKTVKGNQLDTGRDHPADQIVDQNVRAPLTHRLRGKQPLSLSKLFLRLQKTPQSRSSLP